MEWTYWNNVARTISDANPCSSHLHAWSIIEASMVLWSAYYWSKKINTQTINSMSRAIYSKLEAWCYVYEMLDGLSLHTAIPLFSHKVSLDICLLGVSVVCPRLRKFWWVCCFCLSTHVMGQSLYHHYFCLYTKSALRLVTASRAYHYLCHSTETGDCWQSLHEPPLPTKSTALRLVTADRAYTATALRLVTAGRAYMNHHYLCICFQFFDWSYMKY